MSEPDTPDPATAELIEQLRADAVNVAEDNRVLLDQLRELRYAVRVAEQSLIRCDAGFPMGVQVVLGRAAWDAVVRLVR